MERCQQIADAGEGRYIAIVPGTVQQSAQRRRQISGDRDAAIAAGGAIGSGGGIVAAELDEIGSSQGPNTRRTAQIGGGVLNSNRQPAL